MRYFISKTGSVQTVDDHTMYCKQVLHTTLARHLQSTIRVKQHKDYMVVETLQHSITASQHRAIKRLYRQHRCLELIAVVRQVQVSNLKDCVSKQ